MADYKVVDVEKLETELTEVAEEVRILADTQEKMSINKMTENVAQANDTIEVQKDIILEIKTTLEGKASGSKEEQEKALDIIENGSYNILPDEGKVLSSASVNVNIPPKEEQEKILEVTKNGSYEVLPDEGKALSSVNVEVDVAFEGDIEKPFIDTSKITDFSYFCQKNRMKDYLGNLDTSNGTNFTRMFERCTGLSVAPEINTSKGTDFSYMFYNCIDLRDVPLLDTSNGTDFTSMFGACNNGLQQIPSLNTSNGNKFQGMFSGCSRLIEVPLLDTSKGQFFRDMFYTCSRLETVSLTTVNWDMETSSFYYCTALKNLTIGEGWAFSIYLHYSNNLTVESLHGMIENLADLTGKTAKTFQIGTANLAKIDEEHLTMLQNKNWNYL